MLTSSKRLDAYQSKQGIYVTAHFQKPLERNNMQAYLNL